MSDREQWIRAHIEDALINEEFEPWYQPIVRSVTGAISSYESLARWNSPQLGMISPAEFIPILEELHLSIRLDELMLRKVLRDLRKRKAAGHVLQPVSINLSQTDLDDEDLVSRLTALVDEAGIDHDRIIFEITESACVRSPEMLHRVLDELQNASFQVWMDDFGSGYSALNILSQYDFDLIKLDMRFLDAFSFESRGAIVLRHILAMAEELHILTLVEGVEEKEQVMFLRSIACDRLQGYYFQKPAPYSFYEEAAASTPQIPSFTGERKETGAYYDFIRFSQTSQEGMPEQLTSQMQELPQAVLDMSAKDDLVFLRSNTAYMTFLIRQGLVDPNSTDPRFRGKWTIKAQPNIKEAVLKSASTNAWLTFEDMTPNGPVKGWIKAIAEDPVRHSVCFRIIMEPVKHAC